jgi:hemerythrin-like domain-containing protein
MNEALNIIEKGGDIELARDIIDNFIIIIDKDIIGHFQLEESALMTALSTLVDIEGPGINYIYKEHEKLNSLFSEFKKNYKEEKLKDIVMTGKKIFNLLNSHMRKEEESIYYMVNHFLNEEQLRLIEEKINMK